MLSNRSRQRRGSFNWKHLAIILVFAVIVIGILLPAITRVRDGDGARSESRNNLKQIGLSALLYNDTHGFLPWNGSPLAAPPLINLQGLPQAGVPYSGTWCYQILPFIEQEYLFKTANPKTSREFIRTFYCPGRNRPRDASYTDYAINCFLNTGSERGQNTSAAVNASCTGRTFRDVIDLDGTSNTIFAGHKFVNTQHYGEINQVAGEGVAINNAFTFVDNNDANGGSIATGRGNSGYLRDNDSTESSTGIWGGPFPSGGLFVFVDGSVRTLPYSMANGADNSPAGNQSTMFYRALAPDDGQKITFP